jgi:hypothetical protein
MTGPVDAIIRRRIALSSRTSSSALASLPLRGSFTVTRAG